MHLQKYLLLVVLGLLSFYETVNAQKRIVCFWNPMSSNRNGKGIFTIKNIDPHLCTHLVYGYFHIDHEGTIIQPQFGNVDELFIYNFASLRRINPDVKILASIGGPDFSTDNFETISTSESKKIDLANKVLQFVEDFKFDGIDLYWAFPKNSSRDNFVGVLSEVNNLLKKHDKILSISVTPDDNDPNDVYALENISVLVDFINLDIARLHDINKISELAVPHAPVHALYDGDQLNMKSIISKWNLIPNNKIVPGIPTYGRSYTIHDPQTWSGVGATVIGNGNRGEYGAENIRKTSILPFNEICYNLNHNENWSGFFHQESGSPYAVYDTNQWISFDDVESVVVKTELAVIEHELGGVAFYDLDMDDFANDCGYGYFPLITAAYKVIHNDSDGAAPGPTDDPTDSTDLTTDPSDTTEQTTPGGGGEFSCRGRPDGNYQNPNNCRTFFMCANGFKFLMDCPGHLYYHEEPDMCLHTVPEGCILVP